MKMFYFCLCNRMLYCKKPICRSNLEQSIIRVILLPQTVPGDCLLLSSAPLPETWVFAKILYALLVDQTRTFGDSCRTGKKHLHHELIHTFLLVRRNPVKMQMVIKHHYIKHSGDWPWERKFNAKYSVII